MFQGPIVMLADKVLRGTEKMTGTEIVSMTIIGLAVVFAALLLLVLFLYCSGSLFKKMDAGSKKKEAVKKAPASAKPAPKPAAKAQPKAPAAAPAEDDSEIVAVIMAAVAAMGAADGKQYAVRSVHPVTRGGAGRNIWAQAGLSDATRPF